MNPVIVAEGLDILSRNSFQFCCVLFVLSVLFLYDRVTKKIPSRLRADQAPKSGFGLVPIEGFGGDNVKNTSGWDLIFVHGLGSNPDTTWRAKKTPTEPAEHHGGRQLPVPNEDTVCWITDFLRADIPPDVLQRTRAFFFNHDTYWQRDSAHTRLANLGHDLLDRLNKIRNIDNEQRRYLIFVAYSYGGLIVKQALVQARRKKETASIPEDTIGLVFLGTPHRGTDLSRLGAFVARAFHPIGGNAPILQELNYDALPLLDLHRDFIAAIGEEMRVINFFERRKSVFWRVGFFQWSKFCVREQSATFEMKHVDNLGINVDHFGLNKFGSRTDGYNAVSSSLLALLTSSLPPTQDRITSVPLDVVNSYTERHQLSLELENKMRTATSNNSGLRVLVVYGMGGTGKTQLVLRWIQEHTVNYNHILWIDATSPETTRASFDRCARTMNITTGPYIGQGSGIQDYPAVLEVTRRLGAQSESHKPWLLVVDSADDLTWGLKSIIPRGTNGTVIITSQDSLVLRMFNECEKVHVDTMEESEAISLLVRHLEQPSQSISAEIRHLSSLIVRRLGYLALAIDLTGAYLSEDVDQRAALQQYLINYDRHRDSLLRSAYFQGLSFYNKTVWTAWDATFEKIRQRYPDLHAEYLLAFLARFNCDMIQHELFRLASMGFTVQESGYETQSPQIPAWLNEFIKLGSNTTWDNFTYGEAIKLLVRYNLVRQANGEWPGIIMHGLVQWRAKKFEELQSWDVWYLLFMSAVCQQIAREESTPHFRRYIVVHLPDCHRLTLDALKPPLEERLKIIVQSSFAKLYDQEGRWKEAKELLAQVLEAQKKTLGENHTDTLTTIIALASVYGRLGQWNVAEELDTQAIQVQMRLLGNDHPSTLESRACLAWTYWNQGRFADAEKEFAAVVTARKKILGEEHPDTLTSMARLASAYRSQGRWQAAEHVEVELMKIRKQIFGDKHPETLNAIANLATTYWQQARLEQAEELQTFVTEARTKILGEDHPETLISLDNLATIYYKQGRLEKAVKLGTEVAEAKKKKLGETHPETLISIVNLAAMFWEQQHFNEARDLYLKVLKAQKTIRGISHPDTLVSMNNLANVYQSLEQWKDAKSLYLQVLEIRERVLGKDHPDTLAAMANLAVVYWQEEQWAKAEEVERFVLDTRIKVLGKEHPETLTAMYNLALTFDLLGKSQDAMDLMAECVELRTRILGPEHELTKSAASDLEKWQSEEDKLR